MKKTKSFCCIFCSKVYKQRMSYQKHLKAVHNTNEKGEEMDKYTCTMCNIHFYTYHRLKHHNTTKHQTLLEFKCNRCDFKSESKDEHLLHLKTHMRNLRKNGEPCKCTICGLMLTEQSSIKNHIKIFHQKKETDFTRVCPLCLFTTNTLNKTRIYNHFQNYHEMTLRWDHFFFSSLQEFEAWKTSHEQNTLTSYSKLFIKPTSIVYYCDGNNRQMPQEGNDLEVNQETSKFCPSAMKVFLNENNVVVSYLPNHIGHTVKPTFIEHTTQNMRIEHGDNICDRAAVQPLHKLPLTTVTSNNNNHSSNCFTLEKKLMKTTYQPLSLEQFVTGYLSKLDVTEVCLYKPDGTCNDLYPHLKMQDFLLIYMTKGQHHNLTAYSSGTISVDYIYGKDYTMLTMSVMNNNDEGIPVAYMFTNKVDGNTLTIFFESVKQKSGTISCENFLSDVGELIYSTWENVMGTPQHQILSTWHVLRFWRTHFNNLVENKEKREMMYNALQNLVREVDEDLFYDQLKSFLVSDKESQKLLELFTREFIIAGRVKAWSHCYGINAQLNRIMSLGELYQEIGMDQIRSYEVAVVVNLRRIVRKKLHMHHIMRQMKQFQRKKAVGDNHTKSKFLNIAMVEPLGNSSSWKVIHSEDDLVVVERKGDCKVCESGCKLCNTCRHMYLCSCAEYAVSEGTCEHIHLVAQYVSASSVTLPADAQYVSADSATLPAVEHASGDSVMNVDRIGDDFIQQSGCESTVIEGHRHNTVRQQCFDETQVFYSHTTQVCAVPWKIDGLVSTNLAVEKHTQQETSCSDIQFLDVLEFMNKERNYCINYLEKYLFLIEVNKVFQE